MTARTFSQQSFTTDASVPDSFRRAPFSFTTHLLLEAFPEIDDVKNFVSKKVAALTSAEPEGEEEPQEAAWAAAAWDVKQFCDDYSQLFIEPSQSELEKMWCQCAKYRPSDLTAGIGAQLSSWGFGGDLDWQPRLRALFLLEYMLSQPEAAAVARAAVSEWENLLRFLSSEVPQCKSIAYRLLKELLEDRLADPEMEHVVDIDDSSQVYGATLSELVRIEKEKLETHLETGSLPSTDCDTEEQFNPDLPVPDEPHHEASVSEWSAFQKSEQRVSAPGESKVQQPEQPVQQQQQRPYLWLSSVETLQLERAPDPFEALASSALLPL
eukprot:TRINITY_DN63295_c0_g1_i1.p1 TRINITY_DN63295_c0_g1~~TRINITY_DN63295_c0_g1_i1.p1  ORF type:complete len:325 (+),score=89.35 TRINITY_DN63295_c0_g1_i1:74-1048(+)